MVISACQNEPCKVWLPACWGLTTSLFLHAVVPDDKIFVHKLDGVEVDDVIQFNNVLMVGTPNDTIVGRPHVQQVRVLGSIEEHVRDATTYIYKRRRAKGYRRFRGFRAVRLPTCKHCAPPICTRIHDAMHGYI